MTAAIFQVQHLGWFLLPPPTPSMFWPGHLSPSPVDPAASLDTVSVKTWYLTRDSHISHTYLVIVFYLPVLLLLIELVDPVVELLHHVVLVHIPSYGETSRIVGGSRGY